MEKQHLAVDSETGTCALKPFMLFEKAKRLDTNTAGVR